MRPPGRSVLLAVGLALVVAGQFAMRDGRTFSSIVIWLIGIGAIVVVHRHVAVAPSRHVVVNTQSPWSRARLGQITVAVAASVVVIAMLWNRSPSTDFLVVTGAWILAMVYVVLAASWGTTPSDPGAPAWSGAERCRLAAILAVTGAVRLVHLGHFPTIVDGDEAAFALLAREVHDGTLRDPFTTAYWDHGTLFAFVQAGATAVVGDTLAGVRVASALAGLTTVAVTYSLCRRLYGPVVATLAAGILAVLPFHVFFSRVAINNVFDGLAIVALLYLADLAFVDARRGAAALAGIVVGLAQYFYSGGRIFAVLIVPIVLVYAWQHRRAGGAVRTLAALIGWLVAGVGVAFLPLGLHYLDEPWNYTGRTNVVQLSGEWIESEAERTSSSEVRVVARQATDALLLPFGTRPGGNFRPGAPLLGLAVAIPAAIGIAVATAAAHRRPYSALVISWWGSLAAVGMTIGLYGQRWALGGPMAAIAAAIGIDAVWNAARAVVAVRVGAAAKQVTFVAIVVVVGLIHGVTYFREQNALTLYGDANSLIATDVGRRMQDEGAGTTLYMVTAPRLGTRTHATIELLAPGFDGHDVEQPLADVETVPAVEGPALYVLVPERRSELAVIRRRCPGGTVRDVTTRDGTVLYTSYRVDGCALQ